MTRTRLLVQNLIPVAILAALLAVPASAQEDDSLDALSCKQVMLMSGLDRDTTIAFIHGYLSHKRGDKAIDLEVIEAANEIFLDQCLDNPTGKAIATMEAAFSK